MAWTLVDLAGGERPGAFEVTAALVEAVPGAARAGADAGLTHGTTKPPAPTGGRSAGGFGAATPVSADRGCLDFGEVNWTPFYRTGADLVVTDAGRVPNVT